jgi:hypothetical protein
MRLGCGGCLGSLLGLTLLAALVAAPIWVGFRMLQDPGVRVPPASASDAFRAQQKLYELGRRSSRGGRSARTESTVLTETEITAFLSNHLAEAADLPLSGVVARLHGGGNAEILGRLPFRQLLSEEPLATVRDSLPGTWLDRLVWLRLRGDFMVEPAAQTAGRRALRFDVERFWIGNQRLPAVLLRILLHPSALRVLRWPVPEGVEAVIVEPGRLVIRTAGEH